MAGFQQGSDITDPDLRGAINVERGVRNDSMARAIGEGSQIAGMGLQRMAKNQLLGDEATYDNVEVTAEENAEMASILAQEGSQVFTEGLTDLTKLGKARKGGHLSASEARIRANVIQRNVGSTLVGSFMQPELEQAASKFTGNVRGTGGGMFESSPLEKQRAATQLQVQRYVDAGVPYAVANKAVNDAVKREIRQAEREANAQDMDEQSNDTAGYAIDLGLGLRDEMYGAVAAETDTNTGLIKSDSLIKVRTDLNGLYRQKQARLKNYIKNFPTNAEAARAAFKDLKATYDEQLLLIDANLGTQAKKDFASGISLDHEVQVMTGMNSRQVWLAKELGPNYKTFTDIADKNMSSLEQAIDKDLNPQKYVLLEAYAAADPAKRRSLIDDAMYSVAKGDPTPTQSAIMAQVMEQGLQATKTMYGGLNGGDWQGVVKDIIRDVPQSIGAMAGPTWTGMDMEIEELTASMPQYITSTRNRMPAFKEGETPTAVPEYRLRESGDSKTVLETHKSMFMPDKYNDRGKILGARNKQERTMVREWLNVLNAHPSIWKGIGANSAIEYINAKIDPRKMEALEKRATQ